MNYSPSTPPYDYQHQQHLPSFKHMFDSVVNHRIDVNQPPSPPDLLHDSEEDDQDSLGISSIILSPKHINFPVSNIRNRKKSTPQRSPSINNEFSTSDADKSVVFQLHIHSTTTEKLPPIKFKTTLDSDNVFDYECRPKVISGQSLLSALRKRIAYARSSISREPLHRVRRLGSVKHTSHRASHVQIQHCRNRSNKVDSSSNLTDDTANNVISNQSFDHIHQWHYNSLKYSDRQYTHQNEAGDDFTSQNDSKFNSVKKGSNSARHHPAHRPSSRRPSKVKGPCQACQEASDGCMRKAFNWPIPANQVFNDKGIPFVYLCNKCGLRYNKSGGCVCRSCRWVFCKEEKRKALQYIETMRRKRPDGHVDPDEDIEDFVCSPKYWTCGKTWKVGWVLSNYQEHDDQEDETHGSSPISYASTTSP